MNKPYLLTEKDTLFIYSKLCEYLDNKIHKNPSLDKFNLWLLGEFIGKRIKMYE